MKIVNVICNFHGYIIKYLVLKFSLAYQHKALSLALR